MKTLIYTSTASYLMPESELIELLSQARQYNEKNNITGMLLYGKGTFFQVIEGDEDELDTLYRKIVLDSRNYGHVVIAKKEIDKRTFTDWSMGFKNLDDIDIDLESIEGYTNFMSLKKHELLNSPDIVIKLLYQFAQHS